MGSSPAQVSIDWKLLLCTVCSVPSDSGNWILFPADKQLHHVKPLPDLKLISNFAGSLPTERSGQGVAVRMRIPPGRAGGIWGAQTTGKGRRGRAAAGWHVYSSGRDFWVLVEQQVQGLLPGLPCERGFMAREQAGEGPAQPDMRTCRWILAGAHRWLRESQQHRQRDEGWLRELTLWHVIGGTLLWHVVGGRRNANLIGYYKHLNDLMCADKYCFLCMY